MKVKELMAKLAVLDPEMLVVDYCAEQEINAFWEVNNLYTYYMTKTPNEDGAYERPYCVECGSEEITVTPGCSACQGGQKAIRITGD